MSSTWTPERRAAQAERMRQLRTQMTPEQVEKRNRRISKAWTPQRRAQLRRQRSLEWNRPGHWSHVDRRARARRGGRNGWTPERRVHQRQALDLVRLVGPAAVEQGHRNARKLRWRARLRERWTPARRALQAERIRSLPLEARLKGARSKRGPLPHKTIEQLRAWWTPERRREAGRQALRHAQGA